MEYDSVKEEMLSRIDTALKYAKSVDKNAECEIYLLYINSCNVRIQDGVVTADDGIKAGTAVRVAKGKKVSFAPSSGIELDSIKKSIQEATAIVQKLSVEDPRFDSFCPPSGAGKEGVFCSDILDVDSAYLIKAADNMISEAKSVDEVVKAVNELGVRDVLSVTGRIDVVVFLEGSMEEILDKIKRLFEIEEIETTETLLEVKS